MIYSSIICILFIVITILPFAFLISLDEKEMTKEEEEEKKRIADATTDTFFMKR